MVNTEIDGVQDESNPKTDIAYPVGQQWYVCDLNDSKHYEMNTFNLAVVNYSASGSLRFSDGFTWSDLICNDKPTDCWIYCFDLEEYKIKHIFDATLNYSIYDVHDSYNAAFDTHEYTYSNYRENEIVKLYDTDVMEFIATGLGAPDLSWNRILSSEDFLKNVDSQGASLSSEFRNMIESSEWVFTFLETSYESKKVTSGALYSYDYSSVYDVGLLQIHFQDFSGNYYDLGVVADLLDPDDIPDGGTTTDLLKAFEEFGDMFMKIILALAGIALIALLLNFVTPVMGILKFIFKGIVFVICLPFNLLKSIFKKDG